MARFTISCVSFHLSFSLFLNADFPLANLDDRIKNPDQSGSSLPSNAVLTILQDDYTRHSTILHSSSCHIF